MANYLSITEAIELSGVPQESFINKYIDGGEISVKVEDGVKSIELSEFLRVFPNVRRDKYPRHADSEVEAQIKQLKIENLEYQVANLQRQLASKEDEYNWLRTKFDNTTLLLEQKLDTSELDKHKQEIRQLMHQSIQWEKKYNTLLAANELKTLIKENRELKEQMMQGASVPKVAAPSPETQAAELQALHAEVERLQQVRLDTAKLEAAKQEVAKLQAAIAAQVNSTATPTNFSSAEPKPLNKPKRRKIFGVF